MLYSHSNAHNYGYYTAPNQSKYPDSIYFGEGEIPRKVQVHNVYQKVLQTYINFFKQGALWPV